MNCTVCGNPLLFDRVAFSCSCGDFVHAYCWDQHVVQAHPPPFEIGTVNLDGEFVPRESQVEVGVPAERSQAQVAEVEAAEEKSSDAETMGEAASQSSVPDSEGSEVQGSEEETSKELVPQDETSEETSEDQASGDVDTEEQTTP